MTLSYATREWLFTPENREGHVVHSDNQCWSLEQYLTS